MKRSDRMRAGLRACGGQTAIEYLALLGIVAVVVGAITAATIGGDFTELAHRQICRLGVVTGGGGDCPDDNDVNNALRADPKEPVKSGTLPRGEVGEPVVKSARTSPTRR